jgi:uncharacterized repeat protein (TIGR01451 family)
MKQRRFLIILGILVLTLSLLAATTVLASSQGVERLNGTPGVPNNSFPPPPLAEQVQDGSFEAGSPNPFWTESSTNFGTPLCSAGTCGTGGGTAGPNSGTWWAWFGGIGAYEEGAVSQMVTIPAGTTMMTWYQMLGACSGMAQDYLEVNIDGTQEYVIDASDASCGVLSHSQQSIDISAYADGGSHTIEFHSEVFGTGGTTNFSVDDVSIIAPDPLPDIAIDKSPATQDVVMGGNANFTITVTNSGTVDLNNVTVSDALVPDCDNAIGAMTTGTSVSYSCTDVGVVASYTNVAVVDSQLVTGGPGPTATATADVNVISPTSVSLSGFEEGGLSSMPTLLGALVLLVVGLGLAVRRKFIA